METKSADLARLADSLFEAFREPGLEAITARLLAHPELLLPGLDAFVALIEPASYDPQRSARLEQFRHFLRECRRVGTTAAATLEPGIYLAGIDPMVAERTSRLLYALNTGAYSRAQLVDELEKNRDLVNPILSAGARLVARGMPDDHSHRPMLRLLDHAGRRCERLGIALAVVEGEVVAGLEDEILESEAEAVGDLVSAPDVTTAAAVLDRHPDLVSEATATVFRLWAKELGDRTVALQLADTALLIDESLEYGLNGPTATALRRFLNAPLQDIDGLVAADAGLLLTRVAVESARMSASANSAWRDDPSIPGRLEFLRRSRETEISARRPAVDELVRAKSPRALMDVLAENQWLADPLGVELVASVAGATSLQARILERLRRVGTEMAVREAWPPFRTMVPGSADFVPIGYVASIVSHPSEHDFDHACLEEATNLVYFGALAFEVAGGVGTLELALSASEQAREAADLVDGTTRRLLLSDAGNMILGTQGELRGAHDLGLAFGLLTEAGCDPSSRFDPPETRGRTLCSLGQAWILASDLGYGDRGVRRGLLLLREGMNRLVKGSDPASKASLARARGLATLAQSATDDAPLWSEALQVLDDAIAAGPSDGLAGALTVSRAQLLLASARAGHQLAPLGGLYKTVKETLDELGGPVDILTHQKENEIVADLAGEAGNWGEALGPLSYLRERTTRRYYNQQSRRGLEAALGGDLRVFYDEAFACASDGRVQRAVELLEESRRLLLGEVSSDVGHLVEALLQHGDQDLAGEISQGTRRLRDLILGETEETERSLADARTTLSELRIRAATVLGSEPPDENFSFDSVRSRTKRRPIVYVFSSAWAGGMIIVTADSAPVFTTLPGFNRSRTSKLARRLVDGGDLERRQALHSLGGELGRAGLLRSIRELDQNEISFVCGDVMSLCPLQAAWEQANARAPRTYLIDLIAPRYISSARELEQEAAIQDPDSHRSVILVDPGSQLDLPGTQAEVRSIAALIGVTPLHGAGAAPEAVARAMETADVVHLACHGQSDNMDPMASSLHLPLGQLTARDLMALNLGGLRLAVMSACESSAIVGDFPDELFSLPRILAMTGAHQVIGSRWSVRDCATAELMIEFYRHLRTKPAVIALRDAQRVVRDTTAGQKRDRLREFGREIVWSLAAVDDDARPFSNPWFWAGFELWGG